MLKSPDVLKSVESGEPGVLESPDEIYYAVKHDMMLFQPFGYKAYVYILRMKCVGSSIRGVQSS